MSNARFINNNFTIASLLQGKNSPTFFAGVKPACLDPEAKQINGDGDKRDTSMSSYRVLQLTMPEHLQDKPKKLSDIVLSLLHNHRLIAQYNPEQLQKIQQFINEKMKSCASNKEKLAFEQLLEQIQQQIETIVPTLRHRSLGR